MTCNDSYPKNEVGRQSCELIYDEASNASILFPGPLHSDTFCSYSFRSAFSLNFDIFVKFDLTFYEVF